MGQARAARRAWSSSSGVRGPAVEQRVAPLVERDALGQQLGAHAVRGTGDGVDTQAVAGGAHRKRYCAGGDGGAHGAPLRRRWLEELTAKRYCAGGGWRSARQGMTGSGVTRAAAADPGAGARAARRAARRRRRDRGGRGRRAPRRTRRGRSRPGGRRRRGAQQAPRRLTSPARVAMRGMRTGHPQRPAHVRRPPRRAPRRRRRRSVAEQLLEQRRRGRRGRTRRDRTDGRTGQRASG